MQWSELEWQVAGGEESMTALSARVLEAGAGGLSDAELLHLLLGSASSAAGVRGWAEGLIAAGGDLRAFALQDPQELCRLPGFGRRRASQLLCALELGRRIQKCKEQRPRLVTPADIHRFLAPHFLGLRRESFRVLCFNARNRLLDHRCVAQGTVDACPVDPREVFAPAIACRATALVLSHNHPSGDPEPSGQDLVLTAQLMEAGQTLGVRVLDHLIIAGEKFVSLLEQGRMPMGQTRPRAGWNQ
jgi:DNA repair protein RadC